MESLPPLSSLHNSPSPPLPLLQVALGRLQSIVLTVHIPAIKSTRKMKVSLDETIGELIRSASTIVCVCVCVWVGVWVGVWVDVWVWTYSVSACFVLSSVWVCMGVCVQVLCMDVCLCGFHSVGVCG